jgi:hypothetical protein
MVLAIEGHKSGIGYRAREKPALTEGDEIVANAMKDDCRSLDHRQQVDDINLSCLRSLEFIFPHHRQSEPNGPAVDAVDVQRSLLDGRVRHCKSENHTTRLWCRRCWQLLLDAIDPVLAQPRRHRQHHRNCREVSL